MASRWRSCPRRAGHLWDALCRAYDTLGFTAATGGDEVFRSLVLARIIEATSKLDSLRVLQETGVNAPSYRTVTRQAARVCETLMAQGNLSRLRRARGTRSGVAGAL